MNDWLDKEKFRQLPKLNSVLPPGSELYGLERQVRGDGVIFRPVRIDADNIPGGGGGGLIGKELISGGAVWSGTGLIFDVSVLFYRFGENYGTAGPAQVTLDNADPTNPRIDAIVVNEAGMIYVVTGVPSPDPGTPEIAEDELLVQLILVDAGATTPSINIEYIYRDNADWITSTYVTSGPAATGIDFESTDDPYEGTFCIEVNNEDSRKGLRFVRPAGTVDLSNYPILVFWIRFPSVLPANRNLLASVWNGATSVGNVVNFMPLGINRNLVGVWQQVVCPTSAFNASVINRLQMRMDGGGVGVGVSWDLDLIALYTGFAPPSSLSTVSVQENGTTIGSRPTLNFRDGGGVTWDINDSEPQNRININASVVPPITKLGTYFLDDSTTALPPGEISFGSFADITWNGASATKTIYLSFSDLDGNTFRPERFLERGAIIMQRVSNPDDFIVLPIAARAGIGVVPPAIGYMILTTQPEVDGVLQWTGLTSGEFIDVYHIMVSRQTPIYVPSITTPGAFQDALAGFRKGDVISGSDRQPKICTLEAAFSAVWEDYPAGGSGTPQDLNDVLTEGNETLGENIVISDGDAIVFEEGTDEGALTVAALTGSRAWELPDESGTLLVDAPSDNQTYGRNNGAWIVSVPPNVVLDDGSTPFLAPQQGLPAVNSDELVTLGQLQASVECTDWEENPIIPGNYALRGAAYGNGIWLMIGSTSALLGQFLRSTDNYETLTVFTPSTPPGTFSDYDIRFNNGTWILGSSSGARISRSTDNGDTWTDVFTGSAAVRRVKYANGRWIAVGGSAITTLVSDDDGLTWNAPAVPLPAGDWWGVAYGNGVWVAVGLHNPPVAKSTDNGDTWTTVSGMPNNQWYDIEFANGVFIAVAQAGNALRIIRSVDLGDTWTTPTVPSPLIQLFGIAYGNNKWVACGDPGTSRVKESYDNGVTWVNSVPQLFTGNMRFLTFANGWFIAAHTGSIITRQGCVSAPSAIPPTWIDYISQWDIEPILEATITGGNVYAYTWRGVTRYRFVPSTYAPSLDAVYGDFDGVDLTDLITRRNS